jgi:hypothetical protein
VWDMKFKRATGSLNTSARSLQGSKISGSTELKNTGKEEPNHCWNI